MVLNKKQMVLILLLLGILTAVFIHLYNSNQEFKTYEGNYPQRPETGNLKFYPNNKN